MRHDETIWLVIADSARARLIAADPPLPRYRPVADYHRDIAGAEAPDRLFDRPVATASLDSTVTADHAFTHRIAAALDQAAEQHQYRSLVLVAPAPLLHDLSSALQPATMLLVQAGLAQDLTRVADQDLPGLLESPPSQ